MEVSDSIILGVLQGLTEFLPISSSGHLVFAERLLCQKEVPLIYDILLHVASLLAVVIFFRNKLLKIAKGCCALKYNNFHKYVLLIATSSLVTAAMLVVTKPVLYFIKSNPLSLAVAFAFTAVLLLTAQPFFKKSGEKREISFKDAIFIGLFQGVAVIPGVSRSGSTIAAGLMRKISAEEAVEYSFILAIPAILGALLLETIKGGAAAAISPVVIIAGFISSFLSSLVALKLLVFMMKRTLLYPFAIYLFILSALVPLII